MTKKIGILGGTFNPIHNGHLALIKSAINELSLDEVWIMPTKITYYKNIDLNYDEEKVLKNIEDLISNNSEINIKLSKFEIELFNKNKENLEKYGTNYCLSELKKTYEDIDFYFLLGADSLYNIETWIDFKDLLENNVIAVGDRKFENKTKDDLIKHIDYLNKKYNAKIILLNMDRIDVSSTDIRNINE